jgi:hypothetical protein
MWTNKDKKEYSLIVYFLSEEVSRHIKSIKYYWGSLNNLKCLHDFHLELELFQLQLQLFNLNLKDNDPMNLASKIESTMHDIDDLFV